MCVEDLVMQLLQHHLLSEKQIPADVLFGRALLIETCVHIELLNVERVSPAHPTAERLSNRQELDVCERALALKILAAICPICCCELRI